MKDFPVLNLLSQLLKLLGWLIVGLGAIAAIALLIGGERSFLGDMRFPGFIFGVIVAGNGLLLAALGEAIGVLFAIEDNTSRSAEAQTRAMASPPISARSESHPSSTD